MITIPESVRTAWADREGPAVFTTVAPSGQPNAIYVGSVRLLEDATVVVADNYFKKTRANILAGSRGSLLFLTKEGKSYQLKGRIEYLTTGPLFAAMKQWNPAKHPGFAVAALHLDEVFSGGEQLV